MLLFDMGLCNSFPFIIIAALTAGNANDHNRNESLSLSAVQSSWMGSIGYITEIAGAVLSSVITGKMDDYFDEIGQKQMQTFWLKKTKLIDFYFFIT